MEQAVDPLRQFAAVAGDMRDPYPMFAAMRESGPVQVFKLGRRVGMTFDPQSTSLGTIYAVLSREHVQRVLADSEVFSAAGYADVMGPVFGRSILQMDQAEHLRYRGLVAKAFRARALEQWSDSLIRATLSELVDGFATRGRADLVRELTFPFPIQVIARILGLPRADWPELQRLSIELLGVQNQRDQGLAASARLREYFSALIADRRKEQREDLISSLVMAEVDGHHLDDEEILPFLLFLLPAGAETTYRSSSNLLFGLLSEPGLWDTVRADTGLIPQAIEEGLRWESPLLNILRTTTREVELGGILLPAGATVALALGAANRDPARYASPDDFDIFREPAQHVSFGAGPHTCLGMHLARLETRSLLEVLFERLPDLRLDPDAVDPHIHGLMFRSPAELPVVFSPVPSEKGTSRPGRPPATALTLAAHPGCEAPRPCTPPDFGT